MTAPAKPNAALAYRVLDHIDAHPEQWNQGIYIGKADCGTVGCFAGWTVLLSGDKPSWDRFGAGETSYVEALGGIAFVGQRAEELLGVDRYRPSSTDFDGYSDDLFGASNTREDLGRLVEEIFGPRPDGAQ